MSRAARMPGAAVALTPVEILTSVLRGLRAPRDADNLARMISTAAHTAMMTQMMMVMGMPKPGHSVLSCGSRTLPLWMETGRLQ